ncbi:MAG: hypothetical protein RR914_01220 [Oscillospiraceae bacterium]
MSIFEKLYNGEIYVAENSVPRTDEYKNAAHKLSEISEILEKSLDEKQLKILRDYQTKTSANENLLQINIYRQGVIFGFEMAQEITAEKTNKQNRLLENNE